MTRTAAKPLTEEEQIQNALGAAIVNRDLEQLKAVGNELSAKYTREEIESFWRSINSDLTTADVVWLRENLKHLNDGEDVSAEPVKPLSPKELKRLEKLEATITESLRRFENLQLTVGEALTEIDKNKLWRGTHSSFQEYCEDQVKWKYRFGYKRAKQLTSAVQVRNTIEVSTEVELNEKVLRELGREKDIEKRQQIIDAAIAQSPVITEPVIREIRERITPPKEQKALPAVDLTIKPGDLLSIDNPESPHDNKWGRLDSIAPDGKRVKVKIGTVLLVFDNDEVQLERFVPDAIARRVEALCQSTHPHIRELATTFYLCHQFEQWQQDLLDFLESHS